MAIIRKRNVLRQAELDRTAKFEVAPRPAPKAGAYRKKEVPTTLFPVRYKRGELPCAIEHRSSANGLSWVCPLHNLDYEHYLPIFFDGVRCTEDPYKFMARQVRKVGRRSSAPSLHSPLSPDAQGAHELLEASPATPSASCLAFRA